MARDRWKKTEEMLKIVGKANDETIAALLKFFDDRLGLPISRRHADKKSVYAVRALGLMPGPEDADKPLLVLIDKD